MGDAIFFSKLFFLGNETCGQDYDGYGGDCNDGDYDDDDMYYDGGTPGVGPTR